MNIDRALRDPNLLGASIGSLSTWQSWLTVLKATYGIPLSADEQQFFATVSGSRKPPENPVSELWVVAGRRSGKSRLCAAMAVFTAVFQKHQLSAGEIGHILTLSATRTQAKTIFGYCLGFLESAPLLARKIESVTADEIRLVNNVTIATHPNSFRSVRGRTLLGVIFDELAFWTDELSQNPDIEVKRAVQPALAASGGRLIGISSPYRKAGLLYERYKNYFGQDSEDILVVQGNSRIFNPTLKQKVIDRAILEDPEAASAEWNAEFRTDISGFVDRAAVEQCIERDVFERAYVHGYKYTAFVDPSGGSVDSMTLAIAHREQINGVRSAKLDVLREVKPPFSPNEVVGQFCNLLNSYQISYVTGDRYSGEWCREQFKWHGVHYKPSVKPKSEIYGELLPAINCRQVSLLDDKRLVSQLCGLERRTARSGKDSVDHGPGSHDDVINAAAGALTQAVAPQYVSQIIIGGF